MPKIVVDPEVFMQVSNRLRNCINTQAEILAQVETIIYDMFAEWKGQAKTTFQAKFEEIKPDYRKFLVDLEKFSAFLKDYAATIEYLDITGGGKPIYRP